LQIGASNTSTQAENIDMWGALQGSNGDIGRLRFFNVHAFGNKIVAQVSGARDGNNYGGSLIFSTGTLADTTLTERMRIDSSGNVGVGTISLGGFSGTVNLGGSGSPTSGYLGGYLNTQTASSSVTSRFDAFLSAPNTAAAAFTISGINCYQAQFGTKGAGSTITNLTGFRVDSTLTAGTNNFGFLSDIASGTNRWNFYASGTASNYFAGSVLVGTTTAGASKLTVADDSIQINTAKTPASATATGTTGQVCWDASYIYVCTATNTWKRAAIATW
jgi:hypothetical protein